MIVLRKPSRHCRQLSIEPPPERPSATKLPAEALPPLDVPAEPILPAVATRTARRGFRPATAVMLAMLLLSFFLRVLWLDQPPGSMIFDEKYYVSAARTILDLPQPADAPYAHSTPGKDANQEHPPLAKLIMAYDMRLLGDNGWGWRWGSVVAGTLAIAFMYQVGRHLGLGPWTGLLAAFLFSYDNLVFRDEPHRHPRYLHGTRHGRRRCLVPAAPAHPGRPGLRLRHALLRSTACMARPSCWCTRSPSPYTSARHGSSSGNAPCAP